VLRGAIHWHTRCFVYAGRDARIIEECRKSDWIDASQGLARKGVSRAAIKAVGVAFLIGGSTPPCCVLRRITADQRSLRLEGHARHREMVIRAVQWDQRLACHSDE